MNSLQLKKRAFISTIKQFKGIKTIQTGTLPFTLAECVDSDSVVDYKIYGSADGVGDLSDGKYTIPIVTLGKNVFDITKCYHYSADKGGLFLPAALGYGSVAEGTVSDIANIEGDKYYVITATSTSPSGHYVYFRGSKQVWKWDKAYKATGEEKTERIYFYKGDMGSSDLEQDVLIINVQIEQGTTSTDYEPYHAPITTVITLSEPLSEGDYISYAEQAIIHADGTRTNVSLPKIPTYEGTTVLECDTTVAPKSAEIIYYTK